MSRIGKMPITVPAEVDVKIDGTKIKVDGTSYNYNNVAVSGVKDADNSDLLISEIGDKVASGDQITVKRPDDSRESRSYHGLTRTLIANMIEGVHKGYSKKLVLVGVGYRAALKGKDLELSLGFSHPVTVTPSDTITFEVPTQTEIIVSGISKEEVGQVAANVRAWRKPEPYKGKGIRYVGEFVAHKEGKAGKGAK